MIDICIYLSAYIYIKSLSIHLLMHTAVASMFTPMKIGVHVSFENFELKFSSLLDRCPEVGLYTF